ncbi:phage holin family protein [Peptoniphilus indolicus]|uniref:Uncharacterized protein n=2 Tax=Peptoniphilus indolicus TaxID=33030 RepID=G4D1L8_9FIRM|nr:phage holin family protein [Peptoniphilus indolicus]EGY80580.1 hypothetical protein HMPREF9129_0298 [Peptoniphilus indolicus ATCC 29427]SUB75616.1 Membrane protein of uncharacterised function [Peptoniphilus indolicus]SUB94783.1 Membrane protein of uncharacterised function [Peptoniphilus indolicus]
MKLIIKVLVSALAIAIAAALSPMRVSNFSAAIMAAIVMGGLDWLIGNYTNLRTSSAGRGASGFLVGAAVIYITGKLVSGFSSGIIGSLIGAAVLGIVSAIIPGEKTFK